VIIRKMVKEEREGRETAKGREGVRELGLELENGIYSKIQSFRQLEFWVFRFFPYKRK